MAEKKAADQKGFLSTATKTLNLGSSGHTLDGTYMPSIAEKYPRKKTGVEKGFEQLGNFIGRITRPAAAEGATLDGKPGFQNADTKVASSMSGGSYGGYVDAGDARGFVSPEQADRMLKNPEAYKMRPSETRYLRESMGLPRASLGAKEGSLLASADPSKIRGISAPAQETKVAEPKRMAGGFFSPQNFQRSGVPDATIMTGEQMRQSIFGDPGYTRFGSLDRPGTQAAKDTAAFNQRVKSDFFSPVKADARSIAERREASVQSMRDEARERDTQFRATGQQTFGGRVTEKRSGDDTYGTNVMSNPAFGFRSKMSDENKARYDSSAREATRRSEVEPSKGNLIQSTVNVGKRIFNTAIGASEGTPLTREVALEKRGEAEQRRYEKYLNRPMYQREATARQEAGITNQMTIDKNRAQVRADAEARNKAFQAEKQEAEANKRAQAVDRASKRVKENTGTGRDGTFGSGTVGQGMPSNPDFRGPGNNKGFKKSDSSETKNTPAKAVAKATAVKSTPTSRSTGRGGRRGGSTGGSGSSSKGGSRGGSGGSKGGSGGSKGGTGRGGARGGSSGGSGASSKGGVSRGGARTNRSRSRRRCDIRCKFDIMPLTDMNLIKDDLAEVAYFVKELQA